VGSLCAELEPRASHEILDGARRPYFTGTSHFQYSRRYVNGQSSDISIDQFNLSSVQCRPNLNTRSSHLVAHPKSAFDGTTRTVKNRQKAVTFALYDPSFEPVDFQLHQCVVVVEEISPAAISDLCGTFS